MAGAATAKASSIPLLQLPPQLSLLPYLFRMMAFAFFMPVIILAFGDCLGWAFFKLILRPLGYSSVCVSSRILTRPLGDSQKIVRAFAGQ